LVGNAFLKVTTMNFSVIILPLSLFFGNREIKPSGLFIREQHLRNMVSPAGKPPIEVAGDDAGPRQFEQERGGMVSFKPCLKISGKVFSPMNVNTIMRPLIRYHHCLFLKL